MFTDQKSTEHHFHFGMCRMPLINYILGVRYKATHFYEFFPLWTLCADLCCGKHMKNEVNWQDSPASVLSFVSYFFILGLFFFLAFDLIVPFKLTFVNSLNCQLSIKHPRCCKNTAMMNKKIPKREKNKTKSEKRKKVR